MTTVDVSGKLFSLLDLDLKKMSSPLRMDSSEHTSVGSKKSERTVICPHLISKYTEFCA